MFGDTRSAKKRPNQSDSIFEASPSIRLPRCADQGQSGENFPEEKTKESRILFEKYTQEAKIWRDLAQGTRAPSQLPYTVREDVIPSVMEFLQRLYGKNDCDWTGNCMQRSTILDVEERVARERINSSNVALCLYTELVISCIRFEFDEIDEASFKSRYSKVNTALHQYMNGIEPVANGEHPIKKTPVGSILIQALERVGAATKNKKVHVSKIRELLLTFIEIEDKVDI